MMYVRYNIKELNQNLYLLLEYFDDIPIVFFSSKLFPFSIIANSCYSFILFACLAFYISWILDKIDVTVFLEAIAFIEGNAFELSLLVIVEFTSFFVV